MVIPEGVGQLDLGPTLRVPSNRNILFYSIHSLKLFNAYKIIILQAFDNNENPGEEMFAIVANSRAVTEKKIKQSLAERLLQENDGPQPGDVGKGCDR